MVVVKWLVLVLVLVLGPLEAAGAQWLCHGAMLDVGVTSGWAAVDAAAADDAAAGSASIECAAET